jgi:hypothetical protein
LAPIARSDRGDQRLHRPRDSEELPFRVVPAGAGRAVFWGTTNPGDVEAGSDSVALSENFVLGHSEELRVQINRQSPESDWALEVRRVRLPLSQDIIAAGGADAAWTTYAKLTFGYSRLAVFDGDTPTAKFLFAQALFLTECRMPIPDKRFRHALWGQVLHADPEAEKAKPFADILTQAGRLQVNGLAPAKKPENPQTLAQGGVTPSELATPAGDPSMLAALGDRSGVLDASIWAVFDRTNASDDFIARRVAVDLDFTPATLRFPT